MTLLRQTMLVVIAIFILIFSGNFVLTVLESRGYIETQLKAHAQDTATSLGLSLTTALANNDDVNLDLLTSAVFDRGYYSSITLIGVDGQTLIRKSNDIIVDGVPQWFIQQLDLPSPQGKAEITRGWQQLGTLTVKAHPGNAYRDLWRITVDFMWLFGLIVVLSYGLFGIVIRLVMHPLKAVEKQANDICQQQFAILEPVPKTRELKAVVEAMNRMSAKLKETFDNQVGLTEKLRKEAKTDPLTGLVNKREFDAVVKSILTSDDGPVSNVLLLVNLKDFGEVNEQLGFLGADRLLTQVSERLVSALENKEGAILSRRNGAEFAVFIADISFERARVTLETTFQHIATLQQFTEPAFSNRVHMSAAFSADRISLNELLTDADTGLRHAQSSGSNSSYFVIHGNRENPVSELVKQALEWRDIMTATVESRAVLLHFQPIRDIKTSQTPALVAHECFARIELDGEIVNAGVFLPMAERFGLLVDLDKLIITKVLQTLSQNDLSLVINLSTYSIQNQDFRTWLFDMMEQHKNVASRAIFEIQEHAIHLAHDDTLELVNRGHSIGYRFSIDHFGSSATSFGYLQSFNLRYIKIDRSFVTNIDAHIDNQFFVQSVAQIAHVRDIKIIAEGVERQEELDTLISLNVDAAMGYLLGRPGPEISLE